MNIQYRKSEVTGDAAAYTTINGIEIEVTFDSGFWRAVDDNYDEESDQKGFMFFAKNENADVIQFSNFLGAPKDVQENVDKIIEFLKTAPPYAGLKLKQVEI